MKYLTLIDDERREPMGLAPEDRCEQCGGPIIRTTTTGLCWQCMPMAPVARAS